MNDDQILELIKQTKKQYKTKRSPLLKKINRFSYFVQTMILLTNVAQIVLIFRSSNDIYLLTMFIPLIENYVWMKSKVNQLRKRMLARELYHVLTKVKRIVNNKGVTP